MDCPRVDISIIEKVAGLSGAPAHRFLSEGIFSAHRGFDQLLDGWAQGQPFAVFLTLTPRKILYNDIVHLELAKYLQQAFRAPVVVQICDAECPDVGDPQLIEKAAKAVIAQDLSPELTFVYASSGNATINQEALRLAGHIPLNTIQAFSLGLATETLKDLFLPLIRTAGALASSHTDVLGRAVKRMLILADISEDSWIRHCQVTAEKMGEAMPAVVYAMPIPPLSPDPFEGPAISDAVPSDQGVSQASLLRYMQVLPEESLDGNPLKNYARVPDAALTTLVRKKLSGARERFEQKCAAVTKDKVGVFMGVRELRASAGAPNLRLLGKKDVASLEDQPAQLLLKLGEMEIPASFLKHAPITTMKGGSDIGLPWKLHGCICRNLLLQDRQKKLFLVVTAASDQKVDINSLPKIVPGMQGKVSIAKPEVLESLKCPLGCLSPLALANDPEHKVTVVFDQEVALSEYVNMHPLCNDITATLRTSDMLKFLKALGVATYTDTLGGTPVSAQTTDGGDHAPSVASSAQEADKTHDGDSQKVTPWEVSAGEGGIDYDKLRRDFGAQPITEELTLRMKRITESEPHKFLRRQLFYTHRDLDKLLEAREKGIPFYLYTGRGPSSESLHIGHLVPFIFTKWLQDVFKVPLVIQLTDDEKFFFKEKLSLEQTQELALQNAKDIIACGFDPELTFIFTDTKYIGTMYPTVCKIQKAVTFNQAKAAFGFDHSSNIGKIQFPAVEAAPSFPVSFPHMFGDRTDVRCLIVMAIDQDPFFRVTRDVAPRLGWEKPALMHSKFFPALQGHGTKMSGSADVPTTVYLNDTPEQIRTKINKYAVTGGRATAKEQREFGANLDTDVPYQYLSYLIEDDLELKKIGEDYKAGRMLSGEVKEILVDTLVKICEEHQARKAEVTDDTVRHFMDPTRASLRFVRQ